MTYILMRDLLRKRHLGDTTKEVGKIQSGEEAKQGCQVLVSADAGDSSES